MGAQGISREIAEQAVKAALQRYFQDCRDRVPDFVEKHFAVPGNFSTNKLALGWDLLRAPINLFWAPVYVCIRLLEIIARSLGLQRISHLLLKAPSGLPTQIQRNISQCVQRDIFSVGLVEYESIVIERIQAQLPNSDHQSLDDLKPLIEDALNEYSVTRTASADITNAFSVAILGAFAWQKFTPGGFAVGLLLASEISQMISIKGFFLGETLGAFYYGLFPAQPSLGVQVGGIAIALTLMSVFSAFSGFLTDPIQKILGLHRRRLIKMIDSIESDLMRNKFGQFRPKDQYLARLVDAIDMIKTVV